MADHQSHHPREGERANTSVKAPRYSAAMRRTQRLFAVALLLAAGGLAITGGYVDHLNNLHAREQQHTTVQNQLAVLRARMEGNINGAIQTVQGIVAILHTEPDMDQQRFSQLAEPLFEQHTQLRNIGAAPDLVMRMVYPLKGNEAVIGLDFMVNTQQRAAALRARDSGHMIISGPVNLVQGGTGFIGRIPVFIDEPDGERHFWGLVSAVIDTETLYTASGLRDANPDLSIAIRGKDGTGAQSTAFFGNNSVFAQQPVTAVIMLPDGWWEIAAVPPQGWRNRADNAVAVRVVIAVIGLLILMPMLMVALQALKRQENEIRLRGLFDLSPIGIALNDYRSGKFIDVNDALLASAGYSRDEFMKLSYFDVTPREYESAELQQLQNLYETGHYGPYEKEYVNKAGKRYPVLLNGMLIHDRHGTPLIWSIIEDISERKKNQLILAEHQQQLQSFFDLSNNFLCIANVDGYFEKANDAFLKALGISASELYQNPFMSFVHPDDIDSTLHAVKDLANGIPAISFVNRYRCGDGHYISLLWNTAPDPTTGKLYATAVDITRQQQAEAALIAARDAAETATRAKSEFLATMSHEIRTPMNGVLGMLNLLDRAQLDDAQRRKVDIARTSATALLTLINDILDFSKIDAGKLDLDVVDFDLRHLLQNITELMEPRAAEKTLAIVLDMEGIINPMVRGDPGRLRQIFVNLVGNAIKFTEHGKILVRCQLERNADRVVLRASVSDTGIGIAAHKLDALFTAFTQVDASTTRQYGGTGLGLAICRRLCNLMGGEIRVDSRPGQGSEFSFNVKLQVAQSAQAVDVADHTRPVAAITAMTWPPNTRLLLVEDNPINREVARMMLEEMGLAIDMASNGVEALAVLQTAIDAYSLILMDCQMPELDGYDTSRLIRAGSAGIHNQTIPIVAMTANAMKGDREKCLAAGMNDYLSKPIDPVELASTVQRWLQPGAVQHATGGSHASNNRDNLASPLVSDQVWDEQEMLASLSGRQERVDTLLKMYCNGLQERLDAIDQALGEKNAKQLNRVAHTIKGTAAQLRAPQLRKSAAALELAATTDPERTTDWQHIELLVRQLLADSSGLADKFARRLGNA